MPVADASVIVEYLGGGVHQASATAELWAGEQVRVPHLIDAEVGHALRRIVLAGELTESAAGAAINDLAVLPLERTGHVRLVTRAWELRPNLSFYDAIYVALAEAFEMQLITLDARIARAPGMRADVRVLT